MSVRDLLLPAAETFLKLFLKTSGAETWPVQQRRRGRAPVPNRSVSSQGYCRPKEAAGRCSCWPSICSQPCTPGSIQGRGSCPRTSIRFQPSEPCLLAEGLQRSFKVLGRHVHQVCGLLWLRNQRKPEALLPFFLAH